MTGDGVFLGIFCWRQARRWNQLLAEGYDSSARFLSTKTKRTEGWRFRLRNALCTVLFALLAFVLFMADKDILPHSQ